MMRKAIGVLIYHDVQALDVAGPMDAFAAATVRVETGKESPAYDVFTIAPSKRAVVSESGLALYPQYTLESCPRIDTLVIPGGRSLRDPQFAGQLAPWIARQARKVRRLAAVCTGSFALAATGLLNNRRVTTHWRYASHLAERYPALRIDADALFLKDGRFYTSAGITAGIDLALALIEEDLGCAESVRVARDLVVYLRRSGGQTQYSEPLQFEAQSGDRLAPLTEWIATHLHHRITLDALSRQMNLSPRQVSRLFKTAFATTPADFVEGLRMKEAQRRLAQSDPSIKRVAMSLGYRSSHVFRRAFERHFGVSPRAYQERFGARKSS